MDHITRETLDQLSKGFLIMDPDLIITYANPAAAKLLGHICEDPAGKGFVRICSLLGSGFEPSFLAGDRPLRLAELEFSFSTVIREGEISGYTALIAGIAETRLTEKKLKEEIKLYRDIVSATSDWIWECDSAGTFTRVGEAVRETLGYEPEDLFGKTPFEFMPEREASRIIDIFNRIAAMEIPFRRLLNRVVTLDGNEVFLSTSGVPVHDDAGNLKGFRGADIDVTAEVQSRKRLKNSLSTVLSILKSLPSAVVVTDADWKVLRLNDAACRLLGIESGEAGKIRNAMAFCEGCSRRDPRECLEALPLRCRYMLRTENRGLVPVLKTVNSISEGIGNMLVHNVIPVEYDQM